MSNLIAGVVAAIFGLFIVYQGWVLYRDPEAASERMRNGPAARFQPRWAVDRWTPGNMRARAYSMFIGGPVFVVLGVLAVAGVIHFE